MTLNIKNNFDEFNNFLFEKIDLSLYKHKFLNDYVEKAAKGLMPTYDTSVINVSSDGWIIILHGEVLLIYGNNWTQNQIEEISKAIDLNKFTNYGLAGDNNLIDELIEFNKPKNSKIDKRRVLYQTTEINEFNNEHLQIRLGVIKQVEELAEMLQEYYHEEYNGLNDKTIGEMRQRILQVIQTETIFVLLDENEQILSFCTIIDPDIGILFTKREHRNKGYGKVILSYCSQLLRQKNGTVFLMTDRDKPESNIVCEALGFKPYFYYIMTDINCG